MYGYIVAGFIAGSLMWWSKYLLALILLPKGINKWLHNNPFGLLTMDVTLSFLALHVISSAGASGLTTLFVLVFYGMWTMLCMIKYAVNKKAKEICSSFI